MKEWTFREDAAGFASTTMHLIGVEALLPFQGSKWRYRKEIEAVIRGWGFVGAPSRVELVDPGPSSITLDAAFNHTAETIAQLEKIDAEVPRAAYDRLHNHNASQCVITFAAEHLFLQRVSWGGKAVRLAWPFWKAAGYNKDSAEGAPARKSDKGTFGAIRPLVKNTLHRLSLIANAELPVVECARWEAVEYAYNRPVADVHLIDPPYAGTTGYGHLFARADVIAHAIDLHNRGANVIVCEAEPIQELIDLGWRAIDITRGTPKSGFKGQHAREFLTVSS